MPALYRRARRLTGNAADAEEVLRMYRAMTHWLLRHGVDVDDADAVALASAKPLIATRVGGISEIYGPMADALVAPDDAPALARAIVYALDHSEDANEAARRLRERVAGAFTVETMVDGVLAGYRDALEMLQKTGRR